MYLNIVAVEHDSVKKIKHTENMTRAAKRLQFFFLSLTLDYPLTHEEEDDSSEKITFLAACRTLLLIVLGYIGTRSLVAHLSGPRIKQGPAISKKRKKP
jgi:hypothetical protein